MEDAVDAVLSPTLGVTSEVDRSSMVISSTITAMAMDMSSFAASFDCNSNISLLETTNEHIMKRRDWMLTMQLLLVGETVIVKEVSDGWALMNWSMK